MGGVKGRSGGARPNSGGSRKGAGRPPGSRNKPTLIEGLPVTADPLVWLLGLVNSDHAPLRVRVRAAVVLLPYLPDME